MEVTGSNPVWPTNAYAERCGGADGAWAEAAARPIELVMTTNRRTRLPGHTLIAAIALGSAPLIHAQTPKVPTKEDL